jgi:mannose-6-phosphate isomerase-like protein (cupin superfamily)
MKTPTFETEHAPRLSIRAEALINEAFLRVIQTGSRAQIVVMTLPPDAAMGTQRLPETDRVFVVVEGMGEARVGDLEFGVGPGDLVFVHAGTPHEIVNRTVAPLRLITVLAPPAYPAGAVLETRAAAAEAGVAAPAVRGS